jgi:hypothetical protein
MVAISSFDVVPIELPDDSVGENVIVGSNEVIVGNNVGESEEAVGVPGPVVGYLVGDVMRVANCVGFAVGVDMVMLMATGYKFLCVLLHNGCMLCTRASVLSNNLSAQYICMM